jgi:hypothetical protein
MREKQLFANYEFDNTDWNRSVFKLLGGSAVLHLIIFLSLIYVPAIRDAFYVALLFSESPSGWTNKAYSKTGIEDDEIASIINLPPSDALQYPAGYFAFVNGDAPAPDFAATTTPYADTKIVSTDNNLNDLANLAPAPTPFPAPVAGFPPVNPIKGFPAPKSNSKLPPLPKLKKGAKMPEFKDVTKDATASGIPGIPNISPTPKKDDTTAKVETSPSISPIASALNEDGSPKLNKQPWFKLGADFQKERAKMDLNKPVSVTIEGDLDKDGKIVGNLRRVKADGDAQMVEFVSRMIAALDESEMLRYVKILNQDSPKRKVTFVVSKNDKDVSVQILADTTNQTRANLVQGFLNSYLKSELARAKEKGREEAALLEKLAVSTGTNQVIINWQMETPQAMDLLMKKLNEIPKNDAPQPQPSSNTKSPASNAQAAK